MWTSGGVLAPDGELFVLAEDLDRDPAADVRHARHPAHHRAGGIDHPGIVAILEPERDHVVLAVGAAVDDGAVDLAGIEAEVAQQVVGEQLEPVAVVAVGPEGLGRGGPAIDGAVGDVVLLGLQLDPVGHLLRHLALALGPEALELGAETAGLRVLGALVPAGFRHGRRSSQAVVAAVEALALLPAVDLVAPGIEGIGGGEVLEGRQRADRSGAAPTQRQRQAEQLPK